MIEIHSLMDITKTDIHRNIRPQGTSLTQQEWDFKRNQQRNWDTVVQLLGLRFQPLDISAPVKLTRQRPAAYGFGWIYGPIDDVNIWKCTCRYETDVDLWLIRNDFNNIPVVRGLEETILYPYSCFSSTGENINIVITKLS
jgi:hypothetical protein